MADNDQHHVVPVTMLSGFLGAGWLISSDKTLPNFHVCLRSLLCYRDRQNDAAETSARKHKAQDRLHRQ